MRLIVTNVFDSATVPVVYLVFGGHADIYEILYDAVDREIPVLIFPESGGAAGFLDKIIKMDRNRTTP